MSAREQMSHNKYTIGNYDHKQYQWWSKKNLEASEIRRKKGSETTPEILNIENIKAVLNFPKNIWSLKSQETVATFKNKL